MIQQSRNNDFGISKEEYEEWLQLPCTEAFSKFLETQIMLRKQLAGEGACLVGTTFEEIGQKYSAYITERRLYESILEDMQEFEVIIPPNEEAQEQYDATVEGEASSWG